MIPLDIMRIKQAVKDGEVYFYVKDDKIYCANNYGERVMVGTINTNTESEGEK